jgi:hypothetical protein
MIYFFIVFILALFQCSTERSCIALVFLIVTFCCDSLSQKIHNDFYYLVCAFGSWFTILTLRSLSNRLLSLCLQFLCFLSVLLNFLGYMLWVNYYPMTFYNQSFIVLNAGVIITLLYRARSKDDAEWAGNHYNTNVGRACY